MHRPETRAECLHRYERLLPCLADYVHHWADQKPNEIALIEHHTDTKITWARFAQVMDAFSARLLALGLRKGDVIATSLPFLKEHIFLEYACFQIGVQIAPLDMRLKAGEILDAFGKIRPKACFFVGLSPRADFRPIFAEVQKGAPYCKHWIQFQQNREGLLPHAQWIDDFARPMKRQYLVSKLFGTVRRAAAQVHKRDAALLIFTTGSTTGSPKPAMLCHESVLVQDIGLAVAFGIGEHDRMLVNLPPSHVGGQTEQLMSAVYAGATSVVLHVFDPQASLDAIEKHHVTLCGQIPALFQMEWRLPTYDVAKLKSLKFALYGGQAVDKPFLERLRAMAGRMGTGLGLTETAGFCTYTPPDWSVDDIVQSIGFESPLCPMTIRTPMHDDGSAGVEMRDGEVGEICFEGPQLFLGYLNDPESTRKTLSTNGVCYTGDLGWVDERGLHFSGRAKFVIKPKGYQVFPGEVEQFLVDAFPDRIAALACVGLPHDVYTEAMMAFVELRDGATLTAEDFAPRLKEMAAYKRPSHFVFLKAGELPLNRVAKVDVLALQAQGQQEIERLRAVGGWDR
jgi:fatty-acyl-CoA synthase